VSGALVQVDSNIVAVDGHCTTCLQLLADLCGLFVDQGGNVLAINLNGVELFCRVCLCSSSCFSNLVSESAEISVLSNEVSFAVDLDHGVAGNSNETFGCFAVCTLGHGLCALDAQTLDSLVVVSACFFQSLLAVEPAGAGCFVPCLDISSSVGRHTPGDPPCLFKQCSENRVPEFSKLCRLCQPQTP